MQKGSLSTSYSGSGSLRAQDAVSVSIPENVLLTEFLVADGEMVTSGQTLAYTDRVSVMEAIANVQETLDTINGQLQDVAAQKEESTLTARSGGRVMAVYGKAGDEVQPVMLEHGALAIISLDGKLALEISCEKAVSAGTEVQVLLSDGEEISGRVESSLAGNLCVTLPDDAAALGDTVSIKAADGTVLGSGILYAHNEWRAAAYTGRIEKVHIASGESVSDGEDLFTLQDTEDQAEYQILCAKHRVYEEILTELFVLYQDGAVKAKSAGMVTLPEDTAPYLLSAAAQDYELVFLSNEPMGEEGAQYINMVGMVTAFADGVYSMHMCPTPVMVEDYLQVAVSPESMIEEGTFALDPATPVLSEADGQWQQGRLTDNSVGETLLVAYTQETQLLEWIVRLPSD